MKTADLPAGAGFHGNVSRQHLCMATERKKVSARHSVQIQRMLECKVCPKLMSFQNTSTSAFVFIMFLAIHINVTTMIVIAITIATTVSIISAIVAVKIAMIINLKTPSVETKPQLLRSQLSHLSHHSLAAPAALGLGSTRVAVTLRSR